MRLALLIVTLLLVAGCGGAAEENERDRAIAEGRDLADGPCLGVVLENWVADVAHDPREEVDDRPENQCEAYRNGHLEHFVEVGPQGILIRAE